MPKLENFTNRVVIDGIRYRKNELKPIDEEGDLVSVAFTMEANNTQPNPEGLYQLPFNQWTDSSDTPYASKQALLDDMDAFFLTSSSTSPTGNIETLSTSELKTYKVLKPDGSGGVGWQDGLQNIVIVNQDNVSTTLGGVIESGKEYFIDGIIDMSGVTVTIPSSGLELRGYSFDTSKLVCSDDNYKMFISDVGGSGNLLGQDYAIEVTGTNSQVYDLFSLTGNEAFEFNRVNYNDCTSLGEISNYRQGLETGTGRFGGTPNLILSGVWLGGYFIDTSIVRGLSSGVYSLFESGSGFIMNSRFRSNQNIDLPSDTSFFDFAPANFPTPSTVQMDGVIISRNGVFDATDSNLTPNITKSDLSSSWKNNNGIPNTFEGGSIGVASETTTPINTAGVFETVLANAWSTLDLQHFDNPSDGQLRHLGNSPREYKVIADLTVDGGSNDVLTIRITKYDASTASTSTVLDQTRQVNALVGGRDVAFFSININTELDQNDYIFLEVANQTDTTDIIVEADSYYVIEER